MMRSQQRKRYLIIDQTMKGEKTMKKLNMNKLAQVVGGISETRKQTLLDIMAVYILCGHTFKEFLDEVASIYLKADELNYDLMVFLKDSWNAAA